MGIRAILATAHRSSTSVRVVGLVVLLSLAAAATWFLTGSTSAQRRSHLTPRLAVQPFQGVGVPPDLEYFPRGLTASLAMRLAGLRGIQVLGENDPRPADLLLEGEVERSAGAVVITYRLRHLGEGRLVGGGLGRGPMTDLFRLQDRIASDVAVSLREELGLQVEDPPVPPPTRDLLAYDAYLEARDLLARANCSREHARAVALLEESIRRDPGFARGHVALGRAQSTGPAAAAGQTDLQAAARACQRAAQLQADLAEAYLCLGDIDLLQDDTEAALAAYQQALRADAGSLEGWRAMGRLALRLRRFDDAVKALRRVIDLGDESEPALGDLGRAHYWRPDGQDEALPLLRQGVRLGHAALRETRNPAALHLRLAEYHALLAERDAAQRHLDHAMAAGPPEATGLFHAAVVLCELERREEALARLQQAAHHGASRSLLRDAVELDGLRQESRFAELAN